MKQEANTSGNNNNISQNVTLNSPESGKSKFAIRAAWIVGVCTIIGAVLSTVNWSTLGKPESSVPDESPSSKSSIVKKEVAK